MNELVFFDEGLRDRNNTFILDSEEAHHIIHVLRLKEGQKLFLTDGKGLKYRVEISGIFKKSIQFTIMDKEIFEPVKPGISVAVGPVKKRDAIEWMIEKLTELGVRSIHLFTSQNGERSKLNVDRLKKIAISACKQSMNPFLPAIHELTSFKNCLSLFNEKETNRFIAYCDAGKDDFIALKYQLPSDTVIFIGPEGGFSREEIELARNYGFETVSLGQRRLRTETAAIFAVSAINSKFIA